MFDFRFFDNLKAMVEKSPKTQNKEKRAKQAHYQCLPATSGHGHGADQMDGHAGRDLPSEQSFLKDSDGIEECFDSLLFEET